MEKRWILWICFSSAFFVYFIEQNEAAVQHVFTVGRKNVSVEEIQPNSKAYNQCYVSVAVYNSSSHKHGLAGAKVTVLSRKMMKGSTTNYTYTGFSEGITGSSGRVCLLVYCHAEGVVFVEKNSLGILAANKSDQQGALPPGFRVDLKYGNEMVNFDSYVWGTILGHTGPVYTNREKGICENATLNDYHFIFSYISMPDKLVSTPVPINSGNPLETRTWNYGISQSDRMTCYLKLQIKTKSTQMSVKAYSYLNDPTGAVLGLFDSGAKYDLSSADYTSKAVCLQFRCPATPYSGPDMNTFVTGTITDANVSPFCCKSYKETSKDITFQMNRSSFSATFGVGKKYGPADGVYMSNDKKMARSRCYIGHDFLGDEYAMNVTSGYAMAYDCTNTKTTCTAPIVPVG